MTDLSEAAATRFSTARSTVVAADDRSDAISGFSSSETGSVPIRTLSGNTVALSAATELTFDLAESAKGDPFVRLLRRHIRLSSAVIDDPSDGLEVRLSEVVVVRVSSGKADVTNSDGRVRIEVRFRRSSVRCGPPTCIDHDRPLTPVLPF